MSSVRAIFDLQSCSYWAQFYYAHIGITVVNALMGASIWIVIFLTISQYVAICHPFKAPSITKRLCFYLTGSFELSLSIRRIRLRLPAQHRRLHTVRLQVPGGAQVRERHSVRAAQLDSARRPVLLQVHGYGLALRALLVQSLLQGVRV